MLCGEPLASSMVSFSTAESLSTKYNDLIDGSVKDFNQLKHSLTLSNLHSQVSFVSSCRPAAKTDPDLLGVLFAKFLARPIKSIARPPQLQYKKILY